MLRQQRRTARRPRCRVLQSERVPVSERSQLTSIAQRCEAPAEIWDTRSGACHQSCQCVAAGAAAVLLRGKRSPTFNTTVYTLVYTEYTIVQYILVQRIIFNIR